MARPQSGKASFTLLWTSQTFSEFAYSTSVIVLPLLALTITNSPSQAGIIGFVDAVAMFLAGLPAGAVADRYDRRAIMLGCEAAQILVFGYLALSLWTGAPSLTALVLLALVNGAATAMMLASGEALLPTVVGEEKLSGAVALNSARTYAGQLAGTSAGGFLLALKNAFPFAAGALAHLLSFGLLLFLRPPATPPRKPYKGNRVRELSQGIRWIARHPFLRLTLLYAVATNLFFGVIYFIVIASAKTSGMNSGLIGVMAALLGVGGLLGALAAPALQRVLTGSRAVFAVLCVFAVLTVGIALLPGGYLIGILLGAIAFAAPTANAAITTYQLLLTPDAQRGRVMSVANVVSGVGGAIAPLVGGVLFDLTSRLVGLLSCAGVVSLLALSAVLSPTMRGFTPPAPEDDAAEDVPDESPSAPPARQRT
ncbi:MFS transporter [Streptomyces halobius]|uniref:MFS transporter n=1 Tax=Streptomyces halobius TaxID=2879846 RepID=A0ABY4MCF5_9ACTN|nr:MFS transporter [Streptomyces halobius]UQA94001.1 MFS transporter [Streptomyces halobius]